MKGDTAVICSRCGQRRILATSTYRHKSNRTKICVTCTSKQNLLHVKHPGIYPRKALAERFWAKVIKTDGCWLWQGAVFKNTGYGQVQIGKTPHLTHRVAYELTYGKIPDGKFVLHKPPCNNRRCVRTDHLYIGTHQDNMDDMVRRITHCPQGHPYDEINTYHRPDGGRDCKTCSHRRSQEYKVRKGVVV